MEETSNHNSVVETSEQSFPRHHRRAPKPIRDESKTHTLRTVLNLIFIVGCLVGMAWYFYADHNTAFYILIVASVFKFVELTLRIMRL